MATGVIKHNGSYSLQLSADSTDNIKTAIKAHALSHIGEIAHVSFQASSGDFYTQLTNSSIFGVMVVASVGDSNDNGCPWFQIIGTNSVASEIYIISYRGGTWYLNKHNANTSYSFVGSASGSNFVSIPNTFNEYYVMVFYGNYVGFFTIPEPQLPSAQCYATSMLGENQGYAFIGYYLSNGVVYVRCAKFMFGGTDCTSSATTYVYAR